ncbi:MAG: hypothetical protein FRX49_06093 [Trebouxia sp. A1-2]|nr:MAG: hypothetical protein FRX49_06093 [Trebouxia sp. A1-2]
MLTSSALAIGGGGGIGDSRADLCSNLKRDPRGTNCVTMLRFGGWVQAPMNNTTFGCFRRFIMLTSALNSCKYNVYGNRPIYVRQFMAASKLSTTATVEIQIAVKAARANFVLSLLWGHTRAQLDAVACKLKIWRRVWRNKTGSDDIKSHRYGKSRSANRRLLMLKPHASDQGPTPKPTYLSCVFWLTRDSHVTAAPGHVRAVLADESHHLIQVWGQLTGSDGPPFDVEERCAESQQKPRADLGLLASCPSGTGIGSCCVGDADACRLSRVGPSEDSISSHSRPVAQHEAADPNFTEPQQMDCNEGMQYAYASQSARLLRHSRRGV